MKRVPFVTILIALLLSACAQATPTTDPASIQASAVAAANTMVALTQAAIPTSTPIPPTPLPSPTALPSPTLLALPTLAIATIPTQAPQVSGNTGGSTTSGGSNNTGDPCNAPMPAKPAGQQVTVRITNNSGGTVVLSLWLSAKNDFGECGYRGFNLLKGGSITASVPQGCYGAGAFITGVKAPYKAFGSGCLKSSLNGTVTIDKTTVIKVTQ